MFCKKVADRNLWPLMTFLLDGLVDSQAHSSSAACVVLNNIVKLRGSSLGEQVHVYTLQSVHLPLCEYNGFRRNEVIESHLAGPVSRSC